MNLGKKCKSNFSKTGAGWILILVLAITGCHPTLQKEAVKPEEALVRVRYFYPDFRDDMEPLSLENAINQNLRYLGRLDPEHIFDYGGDKYTCRHVMESQKKLLGLVKTAKDRGELNKSIRKEFNVYKAAGRPANPKVLFTGYYEPTFEASLHSDETFSFPIYKRPDDLIEIDLSPFREELKGKSIVGRIAGKKVVPYYTRKQIAADGVLTNKSLEMAWLKDPLDVAFLQIQGSGRLRLRDETVMRVGYETSNGRPYQSIGRYMLERGFITREEMSMQAIRRYLTEHPHVRDEVLNYNPSYVFFRPSQGGPYGSINVSLTPGRSLALDTRLFPKGALCFVKSKKPMLDATDRITRWDEFSRFVLNQDTGGAIKGSGRADLFWGDDSYAEIAAGHMKEEGDLYVLVKKPGDERVSSKQ